MSLWTCLACTARYAAGLLRCPECHSTDYEEDGVPKIGRWDGAAQAAPQEPASDAVSPEEPPAPAAAPAEPAAPVPDEQPEPPGEPASEAPGADEAGAETAAS